MPPKTHSKRSHSLGALETFEDNKALFSPYIQFSDFKYLSFRNTSFLHSEIKVGSLTCYTCLLLI